MANGAQKVFVEESDDDVNTTSTEEDYDPDKEYDVECVLSEILGGDGKMYFLIKWEGYPLHDCTWETKDSITHDIVLRHWETDKRLIKAGQKIAFNVEDYNRAFQDHAEEVKRKRKARVKKRRERGEIVEEEDEDSNDSGYELRTPLTPKRTRAKVVTSPVKKKGVAQPLLKKQNTLSRERGLEQEVLIGSQDTEVDSLFGEPIEKDTRPTPETAKAVAAPATTSTYMGTASTTKPAQIQPAAQSASNAGLPATSARKSAPAGTVGTAKPASKTSVFANWNKPKKPRRRQSISGETAKASTDRQFTHLAHQNKAAKYGRNEPPPDPNALIMVDLKTGARETPRAVPTRPGPDEIHSAYGRRSPVRARKRTPSPPSSPIRRKGSEGQVRVEQPPTPAVPTVDPAIQMTYDAGAAGRLPKSPVTCFLWKDGVCRYTSDKCRYLHADVAKKRQVTCFYWAQSGYCTKKDEDCEFCHYWTEEVAGAPGSFNKRRRSMAVNDSFPVSGANQIRIASPVEQFFTPSSPIDHFGATTTTVAQPTLPPPPPPPPLAPLQHLPHVQTASEPQPLPSEPVADPRLRGRIPRLNDNSNVAPEERPKLNSTMGQQKRSAPNVTGDVEMTDAIDESHGLPEQDLEMAELGIVDLDPTKLLTFSSDETKEVQNVYIHMPDRPDELALLQKYFKDLQRTVYTSSAIGAWKLFSGKSVASKDCLLVVHPTEYFAGALPGLFNLLVTYGASFRVFSIGVQHAQCIRERRKPAYEAQRLFPHGGLTFVTDDVFAYYPDNATQIIEEFIAENEKKPRVYQTYKIATRPGIKNWLMRLATKKMEDHVSQDTVIQYVKAYDAICRLCPREDEDPAFPDQHIPLDSSFLFSPSAESLPTFKGRWESGDEENATDYMANFFAGEACAKVWKYRKFHFVYQRPGLEMMETNSQGAQEVRIEVDPKGWGKKYSHIGVVTPDQFLKKRKA